MPGTRWSTDGARLTARVPASPPEPVRPEPGRHVLDLGAGREVLLHVPSGYSADGVPARLVLTLHGAGGDAGAGLAPLAALADAHRLLLLAPASQGSTWDVLTGGWGPDVRRIALSLGLANADLFTHVLAFSPGFVAPVRPAGTPAVYISHGLADRVLPIDRTTRRIVPQLRSAGVPVQVREFDGPHIVPAEIAEDAVQLLSR
jgi:predicted esterase